MTFADLPATIAAACPIRGFSGSPTDRATWLVDFADAATSDQRAAAKVLMDACPEGAKPVQSVTGNQWAFALGDLNLAAAWRAGVAKSKDKDQVRVGLIARDTQLFATDPLLIRIAANAGTDASGVALIDVPTVFAKALTEPT